MEGLLREYGVEASAARALAVRVKTDPLVAVSLACAAARGSDLRADSELTLHALGKDSPGRAAMREVQRTTEQHRATVRGARPGGGSLRCRACGSNNISTTQRQTRSADEGMDTFCRCNDCENVFKLR